MNATLDTGEWVELLDTKEWVEFKDLDNSNRWEIMEIFQKYLSRPVGHDFTSTAVKQRDRVLESKTDGRALNGFAYVTGEHHEARRNALIRLSYNNSTGSNVTFKFQDYQNQISGFAWKRD